MGTIQREGYNVFLIGDFNGHVGNDGHVCNDAQGVEVSRYK